MNPVELQQFKASCPAPIVTAMARILSPAFLITMILQVVILIP